MTIASYAELQAAVLNWSHRSNLAAARVVEAITLGEERIRADLKVRAMESDATIAIVANTRTVALPSGYQGMRGRLYLSTDPIALLEFVSPSQYWGTWGSSQSGQPKEFTIEADNFVFGPIPASAYTGKALIYSIAALSSLNVPTLFTNNPSLWLSASLVEIGKYLDNDRMQAKWEDRYQTAVNRVSKANTKDRHPGSLVMRPSVSAG